MFSRLLCNSKFRCKCTVFRHWFPRFFFLDFLQLWIEWLLHAEKSIEKNHFIISKQRFIRLVLTLCYAGLPFENYLAWMKLSETWLYHQIMECLQLSTFLIWSNKNPLFNLDKQFFSANQQRVVVQKWTTFLIVFTHLSSGFNFYRN